MFILFIEAFLIYNSAYTKLARFDLGQTFIWHLASGAYNKRQRG